MDEQPMQQVPPPPTGSTWQQTPPPPPNYLNGRSAAAPAAEGLSDTAAGALAYVTIIPAIIFLVMAPYNTKPFVTLPCLPVHRAGDLLVLPWIAVWIVPILGWIVGALGFLVLLVCWIMSIVKASQGSAFKLPVISEFAAKQSGYQP